VLLSDNDQQATIEICRSIMTEKNARLSSAEKHAHVGLLYYSIHTVRNAKIAPSGNQTAVVLVHRHLRQSTMLDVDDEEKNVVILLLQQ